MPKHCNLSLAFILFVTMNIVHVQSLSDLFTSYCQDVQMMTPVFTPYYIKQLKPVIESNYIVIQIYGIFHMSININKQTYKYVLVQNKNKGIIY